MGAGQTTDSVPARERRSWAVPVRRGAPGRLGLLVGLYLATGFIAPPLPPAQAERPDEVLTRVQRRYDMTRDLEATFTQRATLKTLNETQRSSGKVYIKKPGKMRWDYLEPEKQVILLNDDIISVYTPELNQVVEQLVTNLYRAKTPIAFLAGQGKIKDVYRVSVVPINGSPERAAWRLVLLPKEENPQVKELRLDVAKATFDIIRSVIVDHFGNVTDIRYTKMRINRGLDEEIFSLKLPPGVRRVKPPSVPFD